MPDGNSFIAPVGESTFGRSQLQSIDYPKGELHRFTNDLSDYDPALDVTRDGKTLAAIQRTHISDIWTAPAADSSQVRQISSGQPAYDRLAIGPSGKLLTASRDGDVWLMNSDGTAPAVLVPQASNVFAISFCGDRYVVYDSYREGKLELWRTDPDGSNGRKLVDQTQASDCSPDGKWAFYGNNGKLFRISTDGGDPVALVTVAQGAYGVRVSPDGSRVAFAYQEGSPVPVPKLGMVAATGGPLQFIAQVALGSRGLCWSPSGKALQYVLTRNGASNIWEQPLTGGPPQQLTKFTSGLISNFAWSRDGKQLLLTRFNETSDVILISNFR